MGFPLVVSRVGACTAVGLSSPTTCTAIHAGIAGFAETAYSYDRDSLLGAEVKLEQPWRGREKLLRMAESVVRECTADTPPSLLRHVPLILNLAEADRPGRLQGLDASFLMELISRFDNAFHPNSRLLQNGRVGGVHALDVAADFLSARNAPACLIVGVDSLLNESTLTAYHKHRRLLTAVNSDGFIPGEAAGALWLERPSPGRPQLTILGRGYGHEDAHILSELPLKGLGLADAIRSAFQNGGVGFEALDYRICDANGEQYIFREAALALARTYRVMRDVPDIWHAADCIGEVGAATVPCSLAVAWTAAHKKYAPGAGVLAHFGNDDGQRAALTLRFEQAGRTLG